MRLLIISAFYEDHGGGIEVVAGAMARSLARRGHECRWAAAALDSPPEDHLVTSTPFSASDPLERWTGLPMPLPKGAARRQIAREIAAADAVIVHDALYLSSLLAVRFAGRHRKPWILVQHIGAVPYTSALMRAVLTAANHLITRRLLLRAPQAIFISDVVRRYFGSLPWKTPPLLLFNGVDHRLFRPASGKEREDLRVRLGMAVGQKELLFVGRFVEKKGLSSVRELAAANPKWNVRLVGNGPIDPREWELPNVYTLGRKSRQELAELYRAADALVLPSVGEGFPLVIQEAMASGLPVFCGVDSAGADPQATHLLHAITVDPTNPKATASTLSAAINAAALGPDSRLSSYAASTYDWDSNALILERRLQELCPSITAGLTGEQDNDSVTASLTV